MSSHDPREGAEGRLLVVGGQGCPEGAQRDQLGPVGPARGGVGRSVGDRIDGLPEMLPDAGDASGPGATAPARSLWAMVPEGRNPYLWGQSVCRICWAHASLRVAANPELGRKWQERTPAMAAGRTDHCWTMREWLSQPIPMPSWVPPKRRGRPPKRFQEAMA